MAEVRVSVPMLSTSDNPFDPFNDFKDWEAFDSMRGYHTLALLGRVVLTSEELSDADQALAVSDAIDDIVREFGDFYVKVEKRD